MPEAEEMICTVFLVRADGAVPAEAPELAAEGLVPRRPDAA
jgi:hypothetical protein